MSTYKVTLINETEGLNTTIDVAADQNILEAAEAIDLELPSSCCAGMCATCAGKLVSGSIAQTDQDFLDEAQQAAGFVLLCVAKATSDCTIYTHQQSSLQ